MKFDKKCETLMVNEIVIVFIIDILPNPVINWIISYRFKPTNFFQFGTFSCNFQRFFNQLLKLNWFLNFGLLKKRKVFMEKSFVISRNFWQKFLRVTSIMFSWEVVQISLKTSVLESSEFSVAWTNVARVFTPKIRQIYSHAQKLFYNTKQVVSKLFTFC